ncbi:hypothetical protein Pelo_4165 [Pelomyxa schiedti]|nr:hypothetical protein Pelo_4165 [Pelomyxa schiedti]
MVARFGREWVVCGCREVVFSAFLKTGVFMHMWMCVSPTLGVVRSVQFATFRGPFNVDGCIGSRETARRIQPEEGAAACSGGDGGGRRGCCDVGLLMRSDEHGMTLLDIMDGKDRWSVRPWVKCNSRWLVVVDSVSLIMWRLWGGNNDADCGNLFTEECREETRLDRSPVACKFHGNDPDVMLLVVGKSNQPNQDCQHRRYFLWQVDLKESFNHRAVVFKKPPVRLPRHLKHYSEVFGGDPICVVSVLPGTSIDIHNTTTNQTCHVKGELLKNDQLSGSQGSTFEDGSRQKTPETVDLDSKAGPGSSLATGGLLRSTDLDSAKQDTRQPEMAGT